MRVAALTSVSGPYIVARYSSFARHYPDYPLHVIELGRVSTTYWWEPLTEQVPYQRTVLFDEPSELQPRSKLIHALLKELGRIQPDVIAIAGYAEPAMLAAVLWSWWKGKPTILLSASKEDDAPRRWWQELPKQCLLKAYKAALVGGQPQKRYLEKLGMSPKQIFLGYNVVGNQAFQPTTLRSLPNPSKQPFFLCVSRFVPKKNLPNLIAAYAAYVQSWGSQAWDLILCGDGAMRTELEQQVNEVGLSDRVHFPGFLQLDALLPYYAHASCFILPSLQEQWGLVVNEAMSAGLPVLVSKRCGCFQDLVLEGVNGFGFDPEEVGEMAALMSNMTASDTDLQAMGAASLHHIQKFSPDYFAEGLSQAVRQALMG